MKYSLPHKILILALSVIIMLSFLETGLFIAGFNPYGGMKAILQKDSRQDIIFKYKNFVPDPVLLWKLDSSLSQVNSEGFWAEEFDKRKKAGELRVVCIGDSFTLFTWENNYPDYLQALLYKEVSSGKYGYKTVRVINGGLAGYSAFQGVVRFRRILKYNPDIVVFIFGWNDATPANSFPDSVLSSENAFLGKFLSGFRLYNIFRISLLRLTRNEKKVLPRVSLEEYSAILDEVSHLAKKSGIKLILSTRPYFLPAPEINDWRKKVEQYNEFTRQAALSNGVIFMDSANIFSSKKYFRDECHLTPEGYKDFAEQLASLALK